MTDQPTDSAVDYFSTHVREFGALYEQNPDFVERQRVWRELMARYATDGGVALDMGCGTGVFTFELAGRSSEVIGIDAARNMIEFCEAERQKRGVTNVRFYDASLPLSDESILRKADLIVSSSLLEFVADLDGTLRMFRRWLKPGGVLIVSMPSLTSISRLNQRLKFKLTGQPEFYRHIKHFSSPRLLSRRLAPMNLDLLEAHYYAYPTRLAGIVRALGVPKPLAADLFVAVFRAG